MSDIEEELEPVPVDPLSEDHVDETPVSSRRSSFVERTRRLKDENGVEDHISPTSNGDSSSVQSVVVEPEVLAAEVDDFALYDEVDSEWVDRSDKSDKVVVALDEFADIPEDPIRHESSANLVTSGIAVMDEIEVEEELDKESTTPPKGTTFIDTEVVDEVDTALDLNNDMSDYNEATKPRDIVARSSTEEKVYSKTVLAERAATKMQQADAAEAIALAAVKEKAERKAALNAAKRDRDGSAAGGGKAVEPGNEPHQPLPNLPDPKLGINRKHHLGQNESKDKLLVNPIKGDQDGESELDQQMPPSQRSKGFLQRIRKSKAPTVPGADSSADERSAAADSAADSGSGGKDGADANTAGHNSGVGPKPPRRKVGAAAGGRPGRRIASSTAEDGVDSQSRPDNEVLRLPPLVHPRSSPDPSQLGDEDSMKVSENGESSLKLRRHRKPLFLRMIERAQQQTLEDERQKNEQYAEQKKVRQRNNPTAEQLREHRLKHDEMMRAKQEEGRRNMAEAAAANARAAKKLSQVFGAEAVTPTGDLMPVTHNDGTTAAANALNAGKRKKKKTAGAAAAGVASKQERPADEDVEKEAPAASHRSTSKNLSSPKKMRDNIAHESMSEVRSKNRSYSHRAHETGGRTLFPGGGDEEGKVSPSHGHGSPVRNAAKRAQEGLKSSVTAAAQLPDLSTVESVAAFCAPDWLLAFARVDLDEVNNDIEANSNKHSFKVGNIWLQPPPPSLDVQNLMKRTA